MTQPLRTRLLSGDLLIGTILTLPSPEVAEIMASCGFDWLFIDLEHSALDYKSAQTLIMAASPGTSSVLRVPFNDEVWIKKGLDLGPQGIIIPQIRSKKDAERAVRFCKYPPAGVRSIGIARAQAYGMNFQSYVERANNEVAVILQIEHIEAVEKIDSIVQVAGINAIFIGPYDLSGSMGKIGKIKDPDVRKAINRIRDCCLDTGIPLGIFGATVESVQPYIGEGYRLIAVGIDTLLMGRVGDKIVTSLQD